MEENIDWESIYNNLRWHRQPRRNGQFTNAVTYAVWNHFNMDEWDWVYVLGYSGVEDPLSFRDSFEPKDFFWRLRDLVIMMIYEKNGRSSPDENVDYDQITAYLIENGIISSL